ncbi:hypothetical protein [Hymenobacter terrenus]|uniref:hypothetical protein n=1 Tax=Hymenobacter terrenus TaxID=1629124 RepID=UPI0012DFF774|nr:hypothetical protein [Hymenobacter terrenus]
MQQQPGVNFAKYRTFTWAETQVKTEGFCLTTTNEQRTTSLLLNDYVVPIRMGGHGGRRKDWFGINPTLLLK